MGLFKKKEKKTIKIQVQTNNKTSQSKYILLLYMAILESNISKVRYIMEETSKQGITLDMNEVDETFGFGPLLMSITVENTSI
eukprot:jgi/Orpsp1_1/1187036/evm.model.d7180000055012.1